MSRITPTQKIAVLKNELILKTKYIEDFVDELSIEDIYQLLTDVTELMTELRIIKQRTQNRLSEFEQLETIS